MTVLEGESSEDPTVKRPRLSDEEYQVLRKKLRDRKKALQVSIFDGTFFTCLS